jgi:hypothetical protein
MSVTRAFGGTAATSVLEDLKKSPEKKIQSAHGYDLIIEEDAIVVAMSAPV